MVRHHMTSYFLLVFHSNNVPTVYHFQEIDHNRVGLVEDPKFHTSLYLRTPLKTTMSDIGTNPPPSMTGETVNCNVTLSRLTDSIPRA